MENFDNVVSVDEFLDYFFEWAFKPEFDVFRLRSGMGSDEQLREALHSFLEGWESGGTLNPTEAELLAELRVRYQKRLGKVQ